MLVGLIVAVVIIEVIYHVVIAVGSRQGDGEERDVLIEATATRIACFALAARCIGIVGHTLHKACLDAGDTYQPGAGRQSGQPTQGAGAFWQRRGAGQPLLKPDL